MRYRTLYLLVCRECAASDGGALPMPFPNAGARGTWAAEHTEGTGHDHWYVWDEEPYGVIERDERSLR